jgi:hypothetical protein
MLKNYRSFSIPYNNLEQFSLEIARAKHLKKLSEISCSPSNRIDNRAPITYPSSRNYGRKFRMNRNIHLESLMKVNDENIKIFAKLSSISKQDVAKKLKNSKLFKKTTKKDFKTNKIDNSIILQKLTTVKSSLKLQNLEKQFKNHIEYVQLGQRLRLPKIK